MHGHTCFLQVLINVVIAQLEKINVGILILETTCQGCNLTPRWWDETEHKVNDNGWKRGPAI